jgi:hypothetical protein
LHPIEILLDVSLTNPSAVRHSILSDHLPNQAFELPRSASSILVTVLTEYIQEA